jgi:pterin-4a-carbinolamine dehydratase
MDHHPTTWQHRNRPSRLERRFEFAAYDATRDFLDAVAELCEQAGLYPDISFGRTYVNMTIHAEDAAPQVGRARSDLACRIEALAEGARPDPRPA